VSAPANDNLRVRLGAAILALATLAAIVFGIINFQQRTTFTAPDDGVSWIDGQPGVVAWHVSPHSPASIAGLRKGDRVLEINDAPVHSAIDVTKRLWRVGLWSIARYQIERGGKQFEVQLVVQPAERPASIENYLSAVGVLYLFIGLFIFARRWNATRAVHFYIFCLVSFVLYSFR
jgi:two-component system, NtrC family, sensor kinase